MIQENSFFCVYCREIKSRELAGTVFRTGFYKAAMRLGICEPCSDQESKKAIAGLAMTEAVMIEHSSQQ